MVKQWCWPHKTSQGMFTLFYYLENWYYLFFKYFVFTVEAAWIWSLCCRKVFNCDFNFWIDRGKFWLCFFVYLNEFCVIQGIDPNWSVKNCFWYYFLILFMSVEAEVIFSNTGNYFLLSFCLSLSYTHIWIVWILFSIFLIFSKY